MHDIYPATFSPRPILPRSTPLPPAATSLFMDRGAILSDSGAQRDPPYLVRAALILSHASALGALEGCPFGDGLGGWGDPTAYAARLMALYDAPPADDLRPIREVWPEVTAPTPPTQAHLAERAQDATRFPVGRTVHLLAQCDGPPSAERLILDETFTRLVHLAYDWLGAQRSGVGPGEGAEGNVAGCATFAFLHLSALADARPGQPLHVRGGGAVQTLAEKVARALLAHPEFTRLDDRGRQMLGERLLLLPMVLAAAYSYGHLCGDEGAQALAAEVACDELGSFFGVPRVREDLHTLSSLHLGEL